MVTRLHFSNTAHVDPTPATNGAWVVTGGDPGPYRLTKLRDNTPLQDGAVCIYLPGQTCKDRVYVSDPIDDVTGIIDGTVQMQLGCKDPVGTGNPTSRLEIYIVRSDGVLRGTLLPGPQQYGPDNVYHTNFRNKSFADGDVLVPVSPEEGDRLVVVIGHGDTVPGIDPQAVARFGDPLAGVYLLVDETTTTDDVPWIEFSKTITFGTFTVLQDSHIDDVPGVSTCVADGDLVAGGSTTPADGVTTTIATGGAYTEPLESTDLSNPVCTTTVTAAPTMVETMTPIELDAPAGYATTSADADVPTGQIWCGASTQARAVVGWPIQVDFGGTMVHRKSFSEPRNTVATVRIIRGAEICTGEILPKLRARLFKDGAPFFTCCKCVVLVLEDLHGNEVLREHVEAFDCTVGDIEFAWRAEDTAVPRELLGHFEVTEFDGAMLEFPSHSRFPVRMDNC